MVSANMKVENQGLFIGIHKTEWDNDETTGLSKVGTMTRLIDCKEGESVTGYAQNVQWQLTKEEGNEVMLYSCIMAKDSTK